MKKIQILILCIIIVCFSVLPTSSGVAFADEETFSYSNVLDDLQKDETFFAGNYPVDNSNYSLKVIQIAEGVDKELFVYVYQPCVSKDFRASHISMSTTTDDLIDPTIYHLTFCNNAGTLYKYVVDSFTVQDDDVRYYEIYSIYRPFDSTIDVAGAHGNNINEVVYHVAKQWRFGSINGNTYVNCYDIETIVIDQKYVGLCRYYSGYSLFSFPEYTDSHFVAFSTDKDIDELYEADVYYVSKQHEIYNETDTYDDPIEHNVTCYSTAYVESTSNRFLAQNYHYSRIQSTQEFIDSEVYSNRETGVYFAGSLVHLSQTNSSQLTQTCMQALSSTQWVLRFCETSFEDLSNVPGGVYRIKDTEISNVSILRLKFKTNGVVYNLGVVDNMQTSSGVPDNNITSNLKIELSDEFKDFLEILLIVVGIVIAVVLIVTLLPFIIKFIQFIFKIVFAPFKLLFGSSSGRSTRKSDYKRR